MVQLIPNNLITWAWKQSGHRNMQKLNEELIHLDLSLVQLPLILAICMRLLFHLREWPKVKCGQCNPRINKQCKKFLIHIGGLRTLNPVGKIGASTPNEDQGKNKHLKNMQLEVSCPSPLTTRFTILSLGKDIRLWVVIFWEWSARLLGHYAERDLSLYHHLSFHSYLQLQK